MKIVGEIVSLHEVNVPLKEMAGNLTIGQFVDRFIGDTVAEGDRLGKITLDFSAEEWEECISEPKRQRSPAPVKGDHPVR